jgi:hypothetical protein
MLVQAAKMRAQQQQQQNVEAVVRLLRSQSDLSAVYLSGVLCSCVKCFVLVCACVYNANDALSSILCTCIVCLYNASADDRSAVLCGIKCCHYRCKHTVRPLAYCMPYIHNTASSSTFESTNHRFMIAAASTAYNGCSLKHTLLLSAFPLLPLLLLLVLPLLVVQLP